MEVLEFNRGGLWSLARIFHRLSVISPRCALRTNMRAKIKTALIQGIQALLAADFFEISGTRLSEPSQGLDLGGFALSPEICEIKPTECGLISERRVKFPG